MKYFFWSFILKLVKFMQNFETPINEPDFANIIELLEMVLLYLMELIETDKTFYGIFNPFSILTLNKESEMKV